jgi:hypothetical protein
VLILSLVVATLAVARLTRLLTEDRLALAYRRWMVRKYGEESLLAYMAHCPWCTSFWIALPIMPVAVAWPTWYTVAVFAPFAASMLTGMLLEGRK